MILSGLGLIGFGIYKMHLKNNEVIPPGGGGPGRGERDGGTTGGPSGAPGGPSGGGGVQAPDGLIGVPPPPPGVGTGGGGDGVDEDGEGGQD